MLARIISKLPLVILKHSVNRISREVLKIVLMGDLRVCSVSSCRDSWVVAAVLKKVGPVKECRQIWRKCLVELAAVALRMTRLET